MAEENVVVEVDEKELENVREILRTLATTIKTFNLYPKDNPIYQKAATEFFDKFDFFFKSNDELSLAVEQNSLLYKGREVFGGKERADNLALLLFADGIRQISFYKGMSVDEITDFIDILRVAMKSEMNDEDDIVTLLWEKNIKNMGYSTIEDIIDDTLAIEESLLSEGIDRESFQETGTGNAVSEKQPTGAVPFATGEEVLTENDLAVLKNQFQSLEERPLLASAVKLFFEVMSSGNGDGAFPEILQNIGKIIDIRMKNKDIVGTIEIMENLNKLASGFQDPEGIKLIGHVIDKAGSPEKLKILFRESSEMETIRRYLLLLDKNSIPDIIGILGELQDMKQRKLLCEVLAESGRQDIDVFSEALNDERWYLVRNIAMVLGMTKNPAGVKLLEKVVRHPNLKVRREVLKALESIDSEDIKRLFLAALKDEDMIIRIKALKALKRIKDPSLFQTFKQYVSLEELKKKSFEEKREMLETFALLGGKNAFPVLSELFKKKGFIEKDDITEIRAAAAYGLGLVNLPEAVVLVEKESGSRKEILREACLGALREMQKSGNHRK
jgi:hypothetical protein